MDKQIIFTSEPIVIPPPALPTREIGACVGNEGIGSRQGMWGTARERTGA